MTYHFHWNYETVLHLEHWERHKWCDEISKINKKLSNEEEDKGYFEV